MTFHQEDFDLKNKLKDPEFFKNSPFLFINKKNKQMIQVHSRQ